MAGLTRALQIAEIETALRPCSDWNNMIDFDRDRSLAVLSYFTDR